MESEKRPARASDMPCSLLPFLLLFAEKHAIAKYAKIWLLCSWNWCARLSTTHA